MRPAARALEEIPQERRLAVAVAVLVRAAFCFTVRAAFCFTVGLLLDVVLVEATGRWRPAKAVEVAAQSGKACRVVGRSVGLLWALN